MFRKLVSNLPFSPALVGQLGFYAKRLRKEEVTRRLGLIFTALALVVQFFAVFAPSEAANAASDSDFIRGGISSLDEMLRLYDQNANNVKDIYNYVGITRAEIAGAKQTKINSKDGWISYGRTSPFSAAQGNKVFTFDKTGGGTATFNAQPLNLWDTGVNKTYGSDYVAWIGNSAKMGTFAIIKNCANLNTKKYPTPPPKPAGACDKLDVIRSERTKFHATAWGSVSGGAKLTGFHFYVYKSNGSQASMVSSSGTGSPQSVDLNLPTTDNYTVVAYAVTSAGNHTSDKCKRPAVVTAAPFAECLDLGLSNISRTVVRATAKADAQNGASIKGYDFVAKDKNGTVVAKDSRDGSGKSTTADLDLKNAGTYTVEVTVRTSEGTKSAADCKQSIAIKPAAAAACLNLDKITIQRTIIQLKGEAKAENGATIKSYTFTVKDSTGKEVSKQTISSDKTTVTTPNIALNTPGDYTAALAVATSEGVKTDTVNCVEKIIIEKAPVCWLNPSLPATDVNCQPCPGNPNIWIKDERCSADVIKTKTAFNVTKNTDAIKVMADGGDTIKYTMSVENRGYAPTTVDLTDQIGDIMEYATITDNGGGTYDTASKTISWPSVTLAAGEKQTRVFTVKLADHLPATGTGTSNRSSYDCVMTNTYGNTTNVAVNCPAPKVVENVVEQLPKTGPTENMIFAGIVFAIVAFFYARARQMKQEVRLIRRDLNAGTI